MLIDWQRIQILLKDVTKCHGAWINFKKTSYDIQHLQDDKAYASEINLQFFKAQPQQHFYNQPPSTIHFKLLLSHFKSSAVSNVPIIVHNMFLGGIWQFIEKSV